MEEYPSEKVIWSAWFQGVENRPPLVNLCFERWTKLNPSYQLRVVDFSETQHVLSKFQIDCSTISPAALSDILRLHLLLNEGGIWTDASVLPVLPLNEWLTLDSDHPFFAFERPAPDRVISSWFLAAKPNSRLLEAWWGLTFDYWQLPRTLKLGPNSEIWIPPDPTLEVTIPNQHAGATYPYFWFHYLFGRLLEIDNSLALEWRNAVKLPAADAHILQQVAHHTIAEIQQMPVLQSLRSAPLQKLNWRDSRHFELARNFDRLLNCN